MATTISGLSTLGVLFGYAVEATAGTKPAAFTQIERCNAIGGINLTPEAIDSSALEDDITRYIKGRMDHGGSWTVTFNLTNDTMTQIEAMQTAYGELTGGKKMWATVYIPDMTKAFFAVVQPPTAIPLPETGQNELLTIELEFILEEIKGWDTAIRPTAP